MLEEFQSIISRAAVTLARQALREGMIPATVIPSCWPYRQRAGGADFRASFLAAIGRFQDPEPTDPDSVHRLWHISSLYAAVATALVTLSPPGKSNKARTKEKMIRITSLKSYPPTSNTSRVQRPWRIETAPKNSNSRLPAGQPSILSITRQSPTTANQTTLTGPL
jgi:hypothetical protein